MFNNMLLKKKLTSLKKQLRNKEHENEVFKNAILSNENDIELLKKEVCLLIGHELVPVNKEYSCVYCGSIIEKKNITNEDRISKPKVLWFRNKKK